MGGATGNKGGVAIRFNFHSTSFCFVCGHFAAGQNNAAERNADYFEISQKLRFPMGRLLYTHDYIIWCGDFNYRLDLAGDRVKELVAQEDWANLHQYDQLINQRKDNKVFRNFMEGVPNFPPTYKYDLFCDDYDTSEKKRTPAWTDRILWRRRKLFGNEQQEPDLLGELNWNPGKLLLYNRANLKTSDHRPVMALLEFEVSKVNTIECQRVLSDVINRHGPLDSTVIVSFEQESVPLDEPHVNGLVDVFMNSGEVLLVRFVGTSLYITYGNGASALSALLCDQQTVLGEVIRVRPTSEDWRTKIEQSISLQLPPVSSKSLTRQSTMLDEDFELMPNLEYDMEDEVIEDDDEVAEITGEDSTSLDSQELPQKADESSSSSESPTPSQRKVPPPRPSGPPKRPPPPSHLRPAAPGASERRSPSPQPRQILRAVSPTPFQDDVPPTDEKPDSTFSSETAFARQPLRPYAFARLNRYSQISNPVNVVHAGHAATPEEAEQLITQLMSGLSSSEGAGGVTQTQTDAAPLGPTRPAPPRPETQAQLPPDISSQIVEDTNNSSSVCPPSRPPQPSSSAPMLPPPPPPTPPRQRPLSPETTHRPPTVPTRVIQPASTSSRDVSSHQEVPPPVAKRRVIPSTSPKPKVSSRAPKLSSRGFSVLADEDASEDESSGQSCSSPPPEIKPRTDIEPKPDKGSPFEQAPDQKLVLVHEEANVPDDLPPPVKPRRNVVPNLPKPIIPVPPKSPERNRGTSPVPPLVPKPIVPTRKIEKNLDFDGGIPDDIPPPIKPRRDIVIQKRLNEMPLLECYKNLSCLWLNNNEIRRIDNAFANLCSLSELYMNNNRITSLAGALQHLISLEVLHLHDNQLQDINNVVQEFKKMQSLRNLTIFNNPVAKVNSYKEIVIFAVPSLDLLDHNEITSVEKTRSLTQLGSQNEMRIKQSIAFLKCLPQKEITWKTNKCSAQNSKAKSVASATNQFSGSFANNFYRNNPPFESIDEALKDRLTKKAIWQFTQFDWSSIPNSRQRALAEDSLRAEHRNTHSIAECDIITTKFR